MEPPRHPAPPLLEAEAARQASDKIRGYRYQIWLSVDAWLDLGDAELLALEIAEDFDRLRQAEAVTYQVKDVAHHLTLRSPDVVEAIGNFWEHRRRNPGFQLQFRFLTTASIGVEKENPFGSGVPGLEIWASAASTGRGVGVLRDFLVTLSIPEDLKRFLRSVSDRQILVELLQPLQWAWRQGDADFVKERVKQRLVILGQDKALPWDAANSADALFDRVMQAASARVKTDRVLDKAQLLTLFTEKTTRRISLPEAMAGLREFGILEALANIDFSVSPARSSLISGPPPPLSQLATRPQLVDRLRQYLASEHRLVLTGTTGMGKSTLAKLTATGGWLWANLHWEKPLNRRVLQEVAARIASPSPPAGVVFDHYSPGAVNEIPFGALLSRLQDRGVPFIVTTSETLPSRIVTELDLPRDCLVPVPALDRDDTRDILVASGCPASKADELAPIVVLLAAGHPQLVHARIRDLAGAGWSDVLVRQVARSPTVDQVLAEVRTSLLGQLPDGPRTLAYRLGLMRLPFRREHALAVGAIAPPVALPGEAFERLNGPWIERLDDQYYGASALLAGAAVNVWSLDQAAALHGSIARLLLTTKPLTVREAPGALLHAYEGKDSELLAGLAFSVIRAKSPVQSAILPSLQWLLFIGSQRSLPDFIGPADGLAIRELQYRVAPEPEQKIELATHWDHESQSPALAEPRHPFHRLRFTTTMLMDRSTPYPIPRRLQWLQEADGAFAEFTQLHPELDQRLPLEPGSSERIDPVVGLFSFVLHSCDGLDDLHELALGLRQLDEGFRRRLLGIFDLLPALATSLVDRCLLRQARKPTPNWSRNLTALGDLADLGRHWHREDLRTAAVRAQASIMHEFLHDTEAALQLLRRERAGASSAVLEDEEAELLQDQRQHAAALSIWRSGLTRWAAEDDADPIFLGFAAKKAAISACYLGEWAEAARLFLDASTRLRRFHEASLAEPGSEPLLLVPIALRADSAYCLWEAGDRQGSIAAFAVSLSESESLGAQLADQDDFRIFTKQLGNLFLWLLEPSSQLFAQPYPGMFSSPRVRREILRLPTSSFDSLWALLVQLEAATDGEPYVLELVRGRLAASQDRGVQSLYHDAEVAHPLRSAQIEHLIPALAASCKATAPPRQLAPCLRKGMLFGLMSWIRQRPGATPPWEEWRATLLQAAPEETEQIDSWIEAAREVFCQIPTELRFALRQPSGSERPPFQMLRVAIESGYSPQDVFRAQANLVYLYSNMGRPYGDVVAKAVEERWRQLLANPAALIAPRWNAPAILQACDSGNGSFNKAAAIVLAAEPAVGLNLPDAMRRLLTALREGIPDEAHSASPSVPPPPGAAPENH